MQKALHIKTTAQPGGKVEFASPELEAGQTVDVVVRHSSASVRWSAIDILNEAPGHRLLETAADVGSYLKEERASWDS